MFLLLAGCIGLFVAGGVLSTLWIASAGIRDERTYLSLFVDLWTIELVVVVVREYDEHEIVLGWPPGLARRINEFALGNERWADRLPILFQLTLRLVGPLFAVDVNFVSIGGTLARLACAGS